ncbi:MAG: hypothetical protein HRT88_11760 [Lentisphaeraceae bacterium]|nr:hypothetical protein [Lentisphaeraceae bacterium]
MKLSDNDLLLLSHSAISAALQAGKLIADYSKRDFSIEKKTGGESEASQVVTEVDRLSQDLILKILMPTCDMYDLGMLAEESVDDGTRLEKDYFWCIDPLDGTLPFVEKSPGYSAVISLIDRSGVPQIGVIYDPLKQNLYHAIKGQGAFLNGNTWEMPSPKNDGIFTFISDRSFSKHPLFSATMTELEILGK